MRTIRIALAVISNEPLTVLVSSGYFQQKLSVKKIVSLYFLCFFIGCLLCIGISAAISLWYHTILANRSAVRVIGLHEALYATTVGPIIEEFIFRRFLITKLRTKGLNLVAAIGISTTLFTLTHLSNALGIEGNVAHSIGAVLAGVVYGYVYVIFGNVWLSAWTHAVANLMIILLTPQALALAVLSSSAVDRGYIYVITLISSLLLIFLILVTANRRKSSEAICPSPTPP
jgi:membrane protease YdiL (CAAX protease family)